MAKDSNGDSVSNGSADIFLNDLLLDTDKAFGLEFKTKDNLNAFCPWCEDESVSRSPSCSVSKSGAFVCKSCKRRGTAVEFYAHKHGIAKQAALAQLKLQPGSTKAKRRVAKAKPAPRISDQMVGRCHNQLLRSSYELQYLLDRGITRASIDRYHIGLDEQRVTLPVHDEYGNLAQLRRFLAGRVDPRNPKVVCHLGGSGAPHFFPAIDAEEAARADYIVLCEGEWDCILLRQDGFVAYTITSGVSTWADDFTQRLVDLGRPVVILYDVNDEDADLGQRIAHERANHLVESGLEVKVVRLPLPDHYVGGDYTDWRIKEKRTADEVRQLVLETEYWSWDGDAAGATEAEGDGVATGVERIADAPLVTLYDAAHRRHFYKNIRLRCLVAGRRAAPYLLPAKIQVDITMEDGETRTMERTFDPWDGIILNMIKCSNRSQKQFIRNYLGVPQGVAMTVTVLESLNIEELYLIPSVGRDDDGGPYTLRTAYFVGHGTETNRVYEFEGYTLPDPWTQAATHILTGAKPSDTDLDDVTLTTEDYNALRTTFQPGKGEDVYAKAEDIASQLASHITHIYGRSDLHTAIDLVFHSPLTFDFDGSRVRKGWLEALILGDTRTGKGFVTEGLVRHYGVGEVISGENLSFPGLVGGIQNVGDTYTIKWGKIPLADRRALVIDEASNLSHETISRLSRVRSEGIAEVNKILSERTSSRTRLIWLANPRPSPDGKPRKMGTFNYGVEAVSDLIGAAEDVARFDYALTVGQNEVDSKVINKRHSVSKRLIYTSHLCRKLIVWIWSRTADQIVFEDGVVETVMSAAQSLGSYFSSTINLIQAEDVRYKLARIACAVAGRTFSTPDGIHLSVTKEHVEFAYNFLHHIYAKPSCGYSQYSVNEKERSTLRDPAGVDQILDQAGDAKADLVGGLLEHRLITARDLCDYASIDIFAARLVISELVRMRALTKDYNGYIKKPAFKAFLQDLRMNLTEDDHVTSEVDEGESDVQEV